MVIKVTSFGHEFSKKSQNVTKDEKLVKVCLHWRSHFNLTNFVDQKNVKNTNFT